MDKTELVDQIVAFPVLAEVPRAQIEWVIERGELVELSAGEVFFKRGDPIDKLIIVLEGITAFRMVQNGEYKLLGQMKGGDISGALPYSRAQSSSAEGVVETDTKMFILKKGHFRDLICECHEFAEVLVHLMTDRVRDSTRRAQQNEKLMALGKISAGLAHELNNPASAIVRSSELLQKHLGTVPDDFKKVTSLKMTDAEVDFVNDLLYSKIQNGVDKAESLMERTTREDELTDWLEDNGFGDCYMLSETLAEYGFCARDLQSIADHVSAESFAPVLEWGESMLTTEKMVGEIREASDRISKLVTSVKSYSHMDRAGDQEPTNVHVGIHNTLTILNHKLKKNKVTLVEELATDLPEISAAPGELNQVWTNVIDNALDAMEDGGTLTVVTQKIGSNVNVQISDSGPGIPPEVQSRIFEPFFTTKDIGKGTGMGLEVVQKIVEAHKGTIKLTSEPGNTNFEFCFPINTKGNPDE
ncbi:MAG: cyclic nucleotide-binding domain-containing protein [Roseivirga sp.]|nr:cyclic nucleotide-binding domain-containing protein [Roseivirga sp.]